MIRKTSIEAYRAIIESGLLPRRRLEVYQFVYEHGPTTIRETWKALGPERTTGSYSTRFSELRDQGVIEEIGERFDPVTGMTVILWDVTAELPKAIERKKTKIEIAYDEGFAAGERATRVRFQSQVRPLL
jgi:hypothetical protein